MIGLEMETYAFVAAAILAPAKMAYEGTLFKTLGRSFALLTRPAGWIRQLQSAERGLPPPPFPHRATLAFYVCYRGPFKRFGRGLF